MNAIRSTLTVPPRFYEYEKQEHDDDQGAFEEFIIMGGPQKFELKQVEIILDSHNTSLKENVLTKKN